MNTPIKRAKQIVDRIADETDTILLSYSGGKESLACLDLCRPKFKNIICFHYYLVPDLELDKKMYRFAKARYGVEILSYPSPDLVELLGSGVFNVVPNKKAQSMKKIKVEDIYKRAVYDSKEKFGLDVSWVCVGKRKADSLLRRLELRQYELEGIFRPKQGSLSLPKFFPLTSFNKEQVISYLKVHNIPIPSLTSDKTTSSGVSLKAEVLTILKEKYPSDYAKILEVFPQAAMQVFRAEQYKGKKIV